MNRPIHILLVEDNEGDIILTLEAFKEGKINNTVTVMRDGEQAIRFLNSESPYVDAEMPDMVLLDINLPKIDGKEVLNYIKQNDRLKHIPVIMLTTSVSEKDIVEAYASYANCYISKPVDFEKFMQIIRSIEDFWIAIVQLPDRSWTILR